MNLEDKTVAELKKLARDNNIRLQQGIKKDELLKILEVYMNEIGQATEEVGEDILFEHDMGVDGVGGGDQEDEVVEPDAPSFASPEWNEHVMSHFRSDELIDGHPITAGLRRVAELLLGDIIESGPTEVFPSSDSNGPGRATVVYKVVIDWMNNGFHRTFSEVADVWHGNTDDLFCAHPVATASTRAEGRALRKALKIRVIAAEELAKKDIVGIVKEAVSASSPTDGEYNLDDRISPQQVVFIDKKCSQLNINASNFINIGSSDYRSINDVKRDKAKQMIKVLNDYQNGIVDIPEEILGYDKNWRE